MEGFDWRRVNLYFPEWGNRNGVRDEFAWKNFDNSSTKDESILFLWKDKYGVGMFFDRIPEWLCSKDVNVEGISLKDFYQGISEEARDSFLKEAEDSFEVLESWRKKGMIKKYVNKEWQGDIQNHLEFQRISDKVEMFDYYNSREDSPVEKLAKVREISSEFLNSEYLKYKELSSVISGGSSGRCGSIYGNDFSDCVKNADKVYSLASIL